jgi:predicted transcriptional regulator
MTNKGKNILIAVNKEHLDNILDGIKTVEWRKKPLPLGKHYGYETKNKGGCGKITGEFYIVENIKVDLFDIVCNDEKDLIKKGCVDWGFLNKYAGIERPYLYANIIENAKRYDKPKELSEFKAWRDCETPHKEFMNCKFTYRHPSHCECCQWIKRPPQSYMFVE